VLGALAAAQLAFLPMSGQAFNLIPTPKGLDTETRKEGVGATIEFSDITDQDATEVIQKLKNDILPDVKNQLAQFASSKGSNYPDSIVKELETVENEVEALLRQAEGGGNASNLKSLASSIEQQINALKANVGFD
jgi:gas vesicle protein